MANTRAIKQRGRRRRHAWLLASAGATSLLAGCLIDERAEDPAVGITSPAPAVVEADALEVSGMAVDTDGIVRVTWQLNGGAEQEVAVAAGASSAFTFTVDLVDGDNVIVINAYDRNGRVGRQTLRVSRRSDVTAPTLVLSAPADGASVTQPRVRVQGSAEDDRSVRRITWQQAGGAEQTALQSRNQTASFDFEITGLATGSNALTIHAYDAAGNRATVSRSVTYQASPPPPPPPADTAPPTLSVQQPAAGATVNATSVSVSATANDNVAVTRAGWRLNGGAEQALTITAGASATISFTASGLRAGGNVIAISAYDAAGNVGSGQVSVTYVAPPAPDTAPPAVTISAPAGNSTVTTASVSLSGSAADNVAVTRAGWQLNGGAEQALSISAGATALFSASVSGLQSGANTLVVNAYDAAGNKGAQTVALTYNPPAPPPPPPPPSAPTLTRTTLMSGLSGVWDLAFLGDGTMFFTEKCRGLSVRLPDGSVNRILGMSGVAGYGSSAGDLFCEGQSGMNGVAVDPSFGSNRRVYVYSSSNLSSNPRSNRVLRLELNAGLTAVVSRSDIVTDIAFKNVGTANGGSGAHSGGRLRFGPADGYLYITTGDNHDGELPQHPTRLGGKVLRVDTSGAAAPGNNAPAGFDPRIFTYGHRNPQGITFRPGSNRPYTSEHGPGHSDEVTPLTAGGNAGWDPRPNRAGRGACPDNYCGYQGDASFMPMTDTASYPAALRPLWNNSGSSQGMGPSTFLVGAQWLAWDGRLLVGVMGANRLDLLQLDAAGTAATRSAFGTLPAARYRSLVQGPDGNLYIATDSGEVWRVVPN